MKCPICKTNTLNPLTHDGVQLDFCSACKGIWFDKGEAAWYLETSVDMPKLDDVVASARPSSKVCPKCDREMLEVKYRADAALLLDVCGACHGIFLDGGELPKMEALAKDLEPKGKVLRTLAALEGQGYQIMGGKVSRS